MKMILDGSPAELAKFIEELIMLAPEPDFDPDDGIEISEDELVEKLRAAVKKPQLLYLDSDGNKEAAAAMAQFPSLHIAAETVAQ